MNQTVLLSLQDDPDKVGGKRSGGAFAAQKAMACGHGKNGARRRTGKSFCCYPTIKGLCHPWALRPRHLPQKGLADLFAGQGPDGMWVGSSGG